MKYSSKELVKMNNDLLKQLKSRLQTIIDANDLFLYEKSAYASILNLINEIQAQININERKN